MSKNLLRERWNRLPETAVRQLQAEQLRAYLNRVVLPFFGPLPLSLQGARFESQSLSARSKTCAKSLLPPRPICSIRRTNRSIFREFILTPDKKTLARRPRNILRVLTGGRARLTSELEFEFRPVFMTFTTGRSAEPTPFFFTRRDLAHLAQTGKRLVEVCTARPEQRLLNTLPFAPHLGFWLAHYAGTTGGVLTLSSGGARCSARRAICANSANSNPTCSSACRPSFIIYCTRLPKKARVAKI